MTKEEIRAGAEETLDSTLRIFDELGIDLDKIEEFEKLTFLLSLYPDTCLLASLLTAALIRLKKLEDYMKDMSIERDLSE